MMRQIMNLTEIQGKTVVKAAEGQQEDQDWGISGMVLRFSDETFIYFSVRPFRPHHHKPTVTDIELPIWSNLALLSGVTTQDEQEAAEAAKQAEWQRKHDEEEWQEYERLRSKFEKQAA